MISRRFSDKLEDFAVVAAICVTVICLYVVFSN